MIQNRWVTVAHKNRPEQHLQQSVNKIEITHIFFAICQIPLAPHFLTFDEFLERSSFTSCTRIDICSRLLSQYRENTKNCLARFASIIESYIYHYDMMWRPKCKIKEGHITAHNHQENSRFNRRHGRP